MLDLFRLVLELPLYLNQGLDQGLVDLVLVPLAEYLDLAGKFLRHRILHHPMVHHEQV